MKNYLSKIQKAVAVPVVATIIFFSLGASRANAQFVPVSDLAHTTVTTSHSLADVASMSFQNIMKMGLDTLAYGAGQLVLNQLTENTIKWIQGGFHGSPSFAVDTTQLEQDMLDAVAGDVIAQIKGIQTCTFTINYQDDLTDSLLLSTKSRRKFPIKCPFPETLNLTAQGFYEDFNKGGWGLFAWALEDSGNPYGVQIVTAQEMAARQEATKKQSDQSLGWSNGFVNLLDTSDCNYPGEIGSKVAIYNAAQADPASVTLEEYSSIGSGGIGGVNQGSIDTWNKQYCKTTTPGNIVSNQLTKTLGLDMDRLGFADNMNKIIAALIKRFTQDAVRATFGRGNRSMQIQ